MAQAIRRPVRRVAQPVNLHLGQRLTEGLLVAAGGVGLFVLVSLWTHHPADPGWSHTGLGAGPVHNRGGMFGAWLADVLFYLFGGCAYLGAVTVAYTAGRWITLGYRCAPPALS